MIRVRAIFFLVACAKTVAAPPRQTNVVESETAGDDGIDRNARVCSSAQETKLPFACRLLRCVAPPREPGSYASHELYAAASCEFAKRTVRELHDALRLLPLFDRYRLEDVRFRDEFVVPWFRRSMVALNDTVDATVAPFARALLDILDADAALYYYGDRTVLKTFVSLRIKSHRFADDGPPRRGNAVERLAAAVRLLLVDTTALQSHYRRNCARSPPSAGPYFHGFSTDAAEDVVVRTCLRGIYDHRAEEAPSCTVPQMMWRTFVPPSSSDDWFFDRVSGAEVAVAQDGWMTIADVLLRVERSYDPDVVFWYQTSVLNAIVKILLDLIVSDFPDLPGEFSEGSRTISYTIIEFHYAISGKFDRLPEILVGVVKVLYEIATHDDDDENNAREILKYRETLDKSIRVKGTNATDMEEHLDLLQKIFTTISDNIAEFECVQTSLKQLHDEHNYIPFVENKDLLTAYPAAENNESENTCEFLLNTYTLCLEIFRFTNLCRDQTKSTNSTVNCTVYSELLSRVKNYFLTIVKNRHTDAGLLQMSYTIATILVNLTDQRINDIVNVQRILEVIMTELDNNGLKYCTKKSFSFLLFNNINFLDFGNLDAIETSIKHFLIKFDSNPTDDRIDESDSRFDASSILSLNHMNQNFIEDSNVFKYYDKQIQFYWKGTIKTTKIIYKDLTRFASNLLDLNTFYDIYFKFYIAAVYYEVRNFLVLNDYNEDRLKKGFGIISNMLYGFASKYFPNKFEFIISDIQKLYYTPPLGKNTTSISELHKLKEKIDDDFKKLNIIIGTEPNEKSLKHKIQISNIWSTPIFSDEKTKMFFTLNNEIYGNVIKVNSYFLTHQGRSDPSGNLDF